LRRGGEGRGGEERRGNIIYITSPLLR